MDEIELVRGLRVASPASPAERERVRALITAAIARKAAPQLRVLPLRRRVGRPAMLAAAALLLVGTVSAVGAAIFAEWGAGDHPATEAQIRAEIADTQAAIPLPPGEAYPDLFPDFASPNNLAQYLGVQQVQFYAMCSWSNYWLDARVAADEPKLAMATAVISQFPTWQSIADPRLADDTIREQVDQVVAAANAGDAEPIKLLVEAACTRTR